MFRNLLPHYNNSLLKLLEQVKILQGSPFQKAKLCHDIQEKLIARIRYIEKKIRFWKKQFKKAKNQTEKESYWSMVEEYRFILYLFKGIGDSIAYIYIDRWDVKPINKKNAPGFISGKSGFADECRVMRKAATFGTPCLLADLTNVLRHGDVYVFKDGYKPLIMEIKKGQKLDQRGRRQRDKLNSLVEYLDTDKSETFFGDGILTVRIEASTPEVYYTHVMNRLITKSIKNGSCFEKAETGLYYICSISEDTSIMDKVFSLCKKPAVFYLNSLKINHGFYPYYPLILSLKKPEWVLDFYHGELLILVVVDIDVVINRVENKNINISLSEEEDFLFEIWRNEWESIGLKSPMQVSKPFFAKVGMEFLGLDWMIDHIVERVETAISMSSENKII